MNIWWMSFQISFFSKSTLQIMHVNCFPFPISDQTDFIDSILFEYQNFYIKVVSVRCLEIQPKQISTYGYQIFYEINYYLNEPTNIDWKKAKTFMLRGKTKYWFREPMWVHRLTQKNQVRFKFLCSRILKIWIKEPGP